MKEMFNVKTLSTALLGVTGVVSALGVSPCVAENMRVQGEEKPVSLYANGISLAGFIDQLFRLAGKTIVIENDLHAHALNGFYTGSVDQVFERLAGEFDIEKTQVNDVVYVADANTHITMDWLFDAGQAERFVALFSENKSTDHDVIAIVDERIEVTAHRELLRFLVDAVEQDPLLSRPPTGQANARVTENLQVKSGNDVVPDLVFESKLFTLKQDQWQAVELTGDTGPFPPGDHNTRQQVNDSLYLQRPAGQSALR